MFGIKLDKSVKKNITKIVPICVKCLYYKNDEKEGRIFQVCTNDKFVTHDFNYITGETNIRYSPCFFHNHDGDCKVFAERIDDESEGTRGAIKDETNRKS